MDILNILELLVIHQPEWDKTVAATTGSLYMTKCLGERTPLPSKSPQCTRLILQNFSVCMWSCTSSIHKSSQHSLREIFRIMSLPLYSPLPPGPHLVTSPLCLHTSLLTADLLHPQSGSPVALSPEGTLNEHTKYSVKPHPSSVQNQMGSISIRVKDQF